MASIHLIEGPVGAGKSTFAGRLALTHNAVHLNLDEWMVRLFQADRPEADFMEWYLERKQRCINQIWKVTCDLLDAGTDAVLELGLVQLNDRLDFYSRVDASDYTLQVYVLDAPEEQRRQRVHGRNRDQDTTFQMEVSDEIFELASAAWTAPDETECLERNITRISTSSD
jgi:predicted kinase